MAFSDPQSLTIAGVNGGAAISLARIETGTRSAKYANADQSVSAAISHIILKDDRLSSLAAFEQRIIVADPLTAVQDYAALDFLATIRRPQYGVTISQVDNFVQACKAWLSTANVTKLFGQES